MYKIPEIYIRQMRYEQAKQKLINELEKHYRMKTQTVRIIHGIGQCILREMVIEEVKEISYVKIKEDFFEDSPATLLLEIFPPDKN